MFYGMENEVDKCENIYDIIALVASLLNHNLLVEERVSVKKEVKNERDEDCYYGINVIGEFATSSDLQVFEGMSDNGRILVNGLAGIEQYAIALTKTTDSATKGDTHQ